METEEEIIETTQPQKAFHLTYVLAAVNILVFGLMMLVDPQNGIINEVRFGAKVNFLIVDGEYFRLLTAMFLHGNLMHIVFNMMALLNIGVSIEYIFGKTRFLAIYFISGLVASMGSFLFNDNVSVGASGAIFGLLGALLFFSLMHKGEGAKLYRTDTLVIIGLNLLFGFTTPSIDNTAHIFGLLGGFLSCWAILKIEVIPWAKYVRVLSIVLLSTFMIYGSTIGFSNYKGSESYYYNKAVINLQSGNLRAGVSALEKGLNQYHSDRIIRLLDLLKQKGYIK